MNAEALLGAISWLITLGAAITAILAERDRRKAAKRTPAPLKVPVKDNRQHTRQ